MNLVPFPACFAGILGFNLGQMTWIVPALAGIVLAGVIVVSAFYFQHRRREMWHQTARLALEKGQPLPAIPDEDGTAALQQQQDDGSNDFRAGLILLGTGLGLFFFLSRFVNHNLGYVGAIPGFIGVGLLLFGILRLIFKRPSTEPRPPQS